MSPPPPRPLHFRTVCVLSICVCGASNLDALHSFVDALQQSLVLGALEAVLVGVHVGQGADVAVEVLLSDWLLHVRQADISQATDEGSAQTGQLHEQSFVLLLNHLVLVLDALQVLLHRGDLSLQVDHVSLHFIVGFIEVINLFVELLYVLIIVQNITGSELGTQIVLCGELGLLLSIQGSGAS